MSRIFSYTLTLVLLTIGAYYAAWKGYYQSRTFDPFSVAYLPDSMHGKCARIVFRPIHELEWYRAVNEITKVQCESVAGHWVGKIGESTDNRIEIAIRGERINIITAPAWPDLAGHEFRLTLASPGLNFTSANRTYIIVTPCNGEFKGRMVIHRACDDGVNSDRSAILDKKS